MRFPVLAAVGAVLLAAAAPAMADWREPFASQRPINAAPNHSALGSALADVGGTPVVAWSEDVTEEGAGGASVIRVAKLNGDGNAFTPLPGQISHTPTASSYNPSIAAIGGEPWVAWAENLNGPFDEQIRVARPAAGGGWEPVGAGDRPVNRSQTGSHAENPVIVDSNGRPYVAFWEIVPNSGTGSVLAPDLALPANVWVVRLGDDHETWEPVGGGPVNAAPVPGSDPGLKDAIVPDIAVVDGVVWVVYIQAIQGGVGGPALETRAARLSADGRSWQRVLPLSVPGNLSPELLKPPDIAAVGGAPMVAVGVRGTDSARVLVARPRPDGSGWDPVGGGFASPPDVRAADPSLAELSGVPWVAWGENGKGGVARLADGAWQPTAGAVIGPNGRFGGPPHLAAVGGLPWLAFSEDDGTDPGGPVEPGCCNQVRVVRLVPDFGPATTYPAATTAAVLASVQTFGLSYGLGVELTPRRGVAFDAPLTMLNSSQALAELRGLAPATPYTFRPFATAGTPERVYAPAGM